MSLEADIENHERTHPHVWVTSTKSAKVDGNVIQLWYHVLRNSDEHKAFKEERGLS